MDNFTPPLYFEYFALLLWGISGAIVGWRKGYDVVGVFVIAFVSAFGGGLLRDGLFLQRLPVVLTDPNYIFILLLAVAGVTVCCYRRAATAASPCAPPITGRLSPRPIAPRALPWPSRRASRGSSWQLTVVSWQLRNNPQR